MEMENKKVDSPSPIPLRQEVVSYFFRQDGAHYMQRVGRKSFTRSI
jgi:hypothetical protein